MRVSNKWKVCDSIPDVLLRSMNAQKVSEFSIQSKPSLCQQVRIPTLRTPSTNDAITMIHLVVLNLIHKRVLFNHSELLDRRSATQFGLRLECALYSIFPFPVHCQLTDGQTTYGLNSCPLQLCLW